MKDISNHFHLCVIVLLSTEDGLLGSESYTVWTIVCRGKTKHNDDCNFSIRI